MEALLDALPAVLKNLDPNDRAFAALVSAAWNRTAGDGLRKRTTPIGFAGGRLVVAVEDETWRRNLEMLTPQMVFKLNAFLGDGTVRFIEFRVDPGPNYGR